MSKKVTFAQLHDGFFLPGMAVGGQFEKTLPPNKSLKEFSMEMLDNGNLLVSWHEGVWVKQLIVSAANVKVAVLEPVKLEVKAPVKK